MVLPAKGELYNGAGAPEHRKGWDEAKVNDAESHPSPCSGAPLDPFQDKLSEDDCVSLNNMNVVTLPSDVSLQGVNGDARGDSIATEKVNVNAMRYYLQYGHLYVVI